MARFTYPAAIHEKPEKWVLALRGKTKRAIKAGKFTDPWDHQGRVDINWAVCKAGEMPFMRLNPYFNGSPFWIMLGKFTPVQTWRVYTKTDKRTGRSSFFAKHKGRRVPWPTKDWCWAGPLLTAESLE